MCALAERGQPDDAVIALGASAAPAAVVGLLKDSNESVSNQQAAVSLLADSLGSLLSNPLHLLTNTLCSATDQRDHVTLDARGRGTSCDHAPSRLTGVRSHDPLFCEEAASSALLVLFFFFFPFLF